MKIKRTFFNTNNNWYFVILTNSSTSKKRGNCNGIWTAFPAFIKDWRIWNVFPCRKIISAMSWIKWAVINQLTSSRVPLSSLDIGDVSFCWTWVLSAFNWFKKTFCARFFLANVFNFVPRSPLPSLGSKIAVWKKYNFFYYYIIIYKTQNKLTCSGSFSVVFFNCGNNSTIHCAQITFCLVDGSQSVIKLMWSVQMWMMEFRCEGVIGCFLFAYNSISCIPVGSDIKVRCSLK